MKSWNKDKIICRTSSKHNVTLEVAVEEGRMVLNTDNGNYSFGNLHIVFDEVFRKEHIQDSAYKNILLLGMGAGSVIDLLRKNHKQQGPITAVEIDEEIIKLAQQYFGLNEYKNLTVVNDDAYKFAMSTTDSYDLVVIDLYIDLDVPMEFESTLFINRLMEITSKGSKIIFNKVVQSGRQRKQLTQLIALFEKFNPVYHYTLLGFNKILICAR